MEHGCPKCHKITDRRVLPKTSTHSKDDNIEDKKSNRNVKDKKSVETMKENLQSDVQTLKEQVQILQNAVNAMQQDGERKENYIAKLARDKEKLVKDKEKLIKDKDKLIHDLKREKHSSSDLKKQLDNERKYYFEAKESYSQEINEVNRIKKKQSESSTINSKKLEEEIASHKSEIKQLKDALRETLEANYNLSIRFLRMKSTKTQLKSKLKKIQDDQSKLAVELETRISLLNRELNFIVNNKFKYPISPSNKRHLQIIKQNGNLLHENFCLQMEIEKLTEQLNEMHEILTKYKLNNRLKYIQTRSAENHDRRSSKTEDSLRRHKSDIEYARTSANLREDSSPIKLQRNHKESKQQLEAASSKEGVIQKRQRSTSRIHFKEILEEVSSKHSGKRSLEKFRKHAARSEQKKPNKEDEQEVQTNEHLEIQTIFERGDVYATPSIPLMKDFDGKIDSSPSSEKFIFLKLKNEKNNEIKPFGSDGLDLVQISDLNSKTTYKTVNTDMMGGEAPDPYYANFRINVNMVSSERSFRTQSCPDILQMQ